MSRAEKAATEHGYKNGSYPEYSADTVRQAFISGYHQAEKDLELTWEDMRELHIIFADVDTDIELCKTDIKSETLGYYQEVFVFHPLKVQSHL